MPALRSRAGELTGITIRDGADTFTIERRGGEFVAADSGFPVRLDALREVVTQSAGLTFNDARTSDPTRYSELGLADTGDGSGKEIVFRAANGDIADIVVGNNDSAAGSAGGGQFVRIKGAAADLARARSRARAAEPHRLVRQCRFRHQAQRDQEGHAVRRRGRDDHHRGGRQEARRVRPCRTCRRSAQPDAFKVSRLATLFDAFSFQDVRKRTGAAAADARRVVADADGVRVTLTNVGNPSDGWVQVTAEPTATDGKPDKAKAINDQGRRFRIPPAEPADRNSRLEHEGRDDGEAGRAAEACRASSRHAGHEPHAYSRDTAAHSRIPGASPIPGMPPIPGVAPKPEAPNADAAKPEADAKPEAPAEASPAAAPDQGGAEGGRGEAEREPRAAGRDEALIALNRKSVSPFDTVIARLVRAIQ